MKEDLKGEFAKVKWNTMFGKLYLGKMFKKLYEIIEKSFTQVESGMGLDKIFMKFLHFCLGGIYKVELAKEENVN